VKAYTTRVGSGPFPTEILGKGGDLLRFAGQEFGTTTGRPRRCGWLDVVALQYCSQINGFSSLNLTKLDVLSDLLEIQLGVDYEVLPGWQCDISSVRNYSDLPKAARLYVERIEELVAHGGAFVSGSLVKLLYWPCVACFGLACSNIADGV
ncbi:adenylosuccinate synthase, partial [Sarracenia purpurea var. burkii]